MPRLALNLNQILSRRLRVADERIKALVVLKRRGATSTDPSKRITLHDDGVLEHAG